MSTSVVTVQNPSELMDKIKSISGDTKIYLESGDYGTLNLNSVKNLFTTDGPSLEIISASSENKASFTGLNLSGVSNITIDGVVFDYSAAPGANLSHRFASVTNAENVTIKNSVFDGDLATNMGAVNSGYGTGTGLFVEHTDGFVLEGNTFYEFHRGVLVQTSDAVTLSENELHLMSSDGFGLSGVQGAVIQSNYIHDFEAHPNTKAHLDMIQIRNANENRPNSDIVIEDNILDIGGGVRTHGVYAGTNTSDATLRHQDITIENNLIKGAHKNGITVSFTDGLTVQSNTLLHSMEQSPTGQNIYVPKISVAGNVKNAHLADNLGHGINGSEGTGGNNHIIQRVDPNGANYYGDLFVDAMADSQASLTDLMRIEGSGLSGVGADITPMLQIWGGVTFEPPVEEAPEVEPPVDQPTPGEGTEEEGAEADPVPETEPEIMRLSRSFRRLMRRRQRTLIRHLLPKTRLSNPRRTRSRPRASLKRR